jgi:hypothetical protein
MVSLPMAKEPTLKVSWKSASVRLWISGFQVRHLHHCCHRAERIQVGMLMTAETEGVDQLQHLDLLGVRVRVVDGEML